MVVPCCLAASAHCRRASIRSSGAATAKLVESDDTSVGWETEERAAPRFFVKQIAHRARPLGGVAVVIVSFLSLLCQFPHPTQSDYQGSIEPCTIFPFSQAFANCPIQGLEWGSVIVLGCINTSKSDESSRLVNRGLIGYRHAASPQLRLLQTINLALTLRGPSGGHCVGLPFGFRTP